MSKIIEVILDKLQTSNEYIAPSTLKAIAQEIQDLLDRYWDEQRDKDFHDDWVAPNQWLMQKES